MTAVDVEGAVDVSCEAVNAGAGIECTQTYPFCEDHRKVESREVDVEVQILGFISLCLGQYQQTEHGRDHRAHSMDFGHLAKC